MNRVSGVTVAGVVLATLVAGASAPPPANATTRTQVRAHVGPHAHLRVLTVAPRAQVAVKFSTFGSRVQAGTHLAQLSLSFGDGRARRLHRLDGRLHHTYDKPGVYNVALRIADSRGHVDFARQKVVVAGKNHVILKRFTTRLPASRIKAVRPIAVNKESLVITAAKPRPAVGRAVVVARNHLLPRGLIAVVTSMHKLSNGTLRLHARDAGLAAAYKAVRIRGASKVGKTLAVSQGSQTAGSVRIYPATAVPFECDTSSGQSINVTVDLSKTDLGATINLSARIFSFSLISKPVFALGVSFDGEASCHLNGSIGLDFPVPAVPGLVISVAPYFKLSASGSIDASVSWNPFVDIFVLRSPSGNQNFVDFSSKVDAEASGSASVTLSGGLSLTASLAKSAGLELTAGPQITATASVSSSSSCVDVSSLIDVEAKLFARVFFVDGDLVLFHGQYDKTTLLHRCVAGSSGAGGTATGQPVTISGGGSSGGSAPPYIGPTTAETTGGPANTWTDYVHAGGDRGQTISGQQTVGVVCKIIGFQVSDGNTWWYRIGSSPWSAVYYVSADAFYNNGATSGSLRGTPFVDNAVPDCDSSVGSDPTPKTTPGGQTGGSGGTYSETTGGVTHTWTNYSNAGGTEGPTISSNQTVQITCKVTGFQVADGNTWWYQIASDPWNNTYYASADAFYNNGATSGSLRGTPFVDSNVPTCGGTSPPPGHAETTGGVTHTWTNYTNAGGTEGPSIASNQTVQVSCKVTGFQVADGNTWWYRIASDPWNNTYYASADAFYNNGQTSGSLQGTPFVDPAVPDC